jgi:hypothetical protein
MLCEQHHYYEAQGVQWQHRWNITQICYTTHILHIHTVQKSAVLLPHLHELIAQVALIGINAKHIIEEIHHSVTQSLSHSVSQSVSHSVTQSVTHSLSLSLTKLNSTQLNSGTDNNTVGGAVTVTVSSGSASASDSGSGSIEWIIKYSHVTHSVTALQQTIKYNTNGPKVSVQSSSQSKFLLFIERFTKQQPLSALGGSHFTHIYSRHQRWNGINVPKVEEKFRHPSLNSLEFWVTFE